MNTKSLLKLGLLCTLTLAMTGCGGLWGWIATTLMPPPTVPAEYVVPESKSVCVLINDQSMRSNAYSVPYKMMLRINKILQEKEVFANVVTNRELQSLKMTRSDFGRLTPYQIGKLLKVDYVMKVDVLDFGLQPAPNESIFRGRLGATVTLYNVNDSDVAWPRDEFGGRKMPTIEDAYTDSYDSKYATKLSTKMANQMADKIAKLFYDYEKDSHVALPDTEFDGY